MGTKLAPSYANLFMGHLEKKLLQGSPTKINTFLRFIDDIFLILPEIEYFIAYSNSIHPTIKFTAEWSPSKVVFLDTIVKREGKSLYTDLYTKETDTPSYLHYTSSHPKHMKEKGSFGQFLRLRRQLR
jgi:hypothetical protein